MARDSGALFAAAVRPGDERDQFVLECEQRAAAKRMSLRTVEDYRGSVVPLKAFFGAMLPSEIGPHHVTEYLDLGRNAGRSVRANRERPACPVASAGCSEPTWPEA